MDPEDRASIFRCHSGVSNPLSLWLLSESISNLYTLVMRFSIKKPSVFSNHITIVVIVEHPASLGSPLVWNLADIKMRLTHSMSPHQSYDISTGEIREFSLEICNGLLS